LALQIEDEHDRLSVRAEGRMMGPGSGEHILQPPVLGWVDVRPLLAGDAADDVFAHERGFAHLVTSETGR
jgi:hypothetical protein